jgi:uncharacterized protein (DUF885 family)
MSTASIHTNSRSPINASAKALLLICMMTALTGCELTNANPTEQTEAVTRNTATTQLTQLMDEIWHYQLKSSPIDATYKGVSQYNHLLEDLSPAAMAKNIERLKGYVGQLNAIEVKSLSSENIINLDILLRQLNASIDSYHFNAHYVPLSAESGFHSSPAFWPSIMPFKKLQDYENYLSRLKSLPTFFAQNTHWMKKGMKSGITQPSAVLVGFENGIKAFIVDDVTKSIFYKPFEGKIPTGISEGEFNQLKSQAATLLSEQVLPAYQQFYDFMVNTYIPAARTTIGVGDTPNGVDYYNNQVKYYTTTDITAEEVHQLGLKEVARIRAEMAMIIKEVDFKGSFADFIHFLRTDKQFYATTPEELLREASYIAKKMDAQLPALFKHLPRTPYGVAPVPDHLAPKYTTGRYVGPSRDDQPGYYWVNTYGLDKRPLYVLEALTLHEAVPGHHLQGSINRELTDVPPHRKYSYISAFGEGWGLYSEFLGIEAGFYKDPYSNFGRLTYEMWRACRLVVDTGMHVKGWSRQRAIDFLQSNTALSTHNVKTEIDRYISWPAQALSYKMGELTIKRLRREAEAALGAKFDIREFHDQVLKHGSVPLKVLEQLIMDYIEQTLGQSK